MIVYEVAHRRNFERLKTWLNHGKLHDIIKIRLGSVQTHDGDKWRQWSFVDGEWRHDETCAEPSVRLTLDEAIKYLGLTLADMGVAA